MRPLPAMVFCGDSRLQSAHSHQDKQSDSFYLNRLTNRKFLRFMATLTKSDIRKLRKKKARLKRKLKCRFCPDGVVPRPVYVDYKDVKTLRQLIDREGKIQPRRRTGTSALYQRAVRHAVLRARFMGLLPYVVEE